MYLCHPAAGAAAQLLKVQGLSLVQRMSLFGHCRLRPLQQPHLRRQATLSHTFFKTFWLGFFFFPCVPWTCYSDMAAALQASQRPFLHLLQSPCVGLLILYSLQYFLLEAKSV